MTAAAIARALGGAAREGNEWRCRCPLHGGRSLTLRDGEGGRLLAKCFGGCEMRDVLCELRRLGLLDTAPLSFQTVQTPQVRRDCRARALAIWRDARPITGTFAEKYLAARGICLNDLPVEARTNLRFHPNCPHPGGARFPAMLGLAEHVEHGAVAVHRTFLKPDGSGKADVEPDKATFVPLAVVPCGLEQRARINGSFSRKVSRQPPVSPLRVV